MGKSGKNQHLNLVLMCLLCNDKSDGRRNHRDKYCCLQVLKLFISYPNDRITFHKKLWCLLFQIYSLFHTKFDQGKF